jgi:hypothetical protein
VCFYTIILDKDFSRFPWASGFLTTNEVLCFLHCFPCIQFMYLEIPFPFSCFVLFCFVLFSLRGCFVWSGGSILVMSGWGLASCGFIVLWSMNLWAVYAQGRKWLRMIAAAQT